MMTPGLASPKYILTSLPCNLTSLTSHVSVGLQSKFPMSTQPIPILATGRGEQIGRTVMETLKPEYEGENEAVQCLQPKSL